MSFAEDIVEIEIRQWEALRSPHSAKAYYDEYFTGDALMATPVGIDDRANLLKEIEASPVITDYDIRDPRIMVLGENVGAIVYIMTQFRDGHEPFDAAICSIFARDGGRWRMAYHQQTPLQ